MKYGIALVLAFVACQNIYYAVSGYRNGKAGWFAGKGLMLSADRKDDPVGFSTAVWGNVAAAAFALSIAGWTLFG